MSSGDNRGQASGILILVGGILLAGGLTGFFLVVPPAPPEEGQEMIVGEVWIENAPSSGENFTVSIAFRTFRDGEYSGGYVFEPVPDEIWKGKAEYYVDDEWRHGTIKVTFVGNVFGWGNWVKLGVKGRMNIPIMQSQPSYPQAYYVLKPYYVRIFVGERNPYPVANFSYDVDGLTVSFVDRSTDEDGNIESWHWEFGNGESSEEQNPIHVYDNAGEYKVVLGVEDDTGNHGYVEKTIQVGGGEEEEHSPMANFSYDVEPHF